MVRLYCLTRIYKIEPTKYYYGEKVIPYPDGADENLHTGIKEEMTATYISELHFSQYYEFTEISVGYKIVNDRKVFVMHFYRDDTRLCVIRMIRGAVRHRQATKNALDLTISTSTLFPGKVKVDLFMRIRWIKATPTGKNIIAKEEEKLYREFAEARKNEKIEEMCYSHIIVDNKVVFNLESNAETFFEDLKFEMPNSSKPNVLRTKMSRFLTLIKCLCDPNVGGYKNVPNDYEYNQQVKCFLAERFWTCKNPRKNELEKTSLNFRGCQEMSWNNLSMENQNLDKVNAEMVVSATFEHVKIFDADRNLYPNFKKMFQQNSNFKIMKFLTLNLCWIQELTDEFLDILPERMMYLYCNENNVTKISKKISKFRELKGLELNGNKELGNDGIPWESLPPSLRELKLLKTNITHIPLQISKLPNLEILEISSNNLQHIEWQGLSDSVNRLIIEGGKQLNEIDLTSKLNLQKLHILQTGLTEIDCTKLPSNIQELKIGNNKINEFDAKKILNNVELLFLINNGLKTVKWENLPTLLMGLFIGRNQLTSFDAGISPLPILRNISAEFNNISRISDDIWRLQLLLILDLKNNEISSLPNRFELLLNLKELHLSHNRFNYHQTDLKETLWKRLPPNLKILHLGKNLLHSLPCWLKQYDLTDFEVDDCKLVQICPNLYSKHYNLNIARNKGIRFLPFIPLQIHNANEDDVNSSDFTIFIDSEMLIGKPISAMEPMYQFKRTEDSNLGCQCCANCGNKTDESVIEQLMIMDVNLNIFKEINDLEDQKEDDNDEDKRYPADSLNPLLPAFAINVPSACIHYSAGKWQTVVRTRLCHECFKSIKTKIHDSKKVYIKKKKLNENKNEKFCVPLSFHLLLCSSNDNNSFLNAAVNLLDAMTSLRNAICKITFKNAFENELANILQRKVNTVWNLQNLIPQDTFGKNCKNASVFIKLMELLNNEIKELFQFSYEKSEFCKCGIYKTEGASRCYILSINVGSMLTSAESFETMLNRWYKFEPKFCFCCHRNTSQKPVHIIDKNQKYFIVEMDSWVKQNKKDIQQCRISSEKFNIDSQEIFGKSWKLIAAIYGDGFDRYSTWRRFKNKWIINTNAEFIIFDKLFEDLKDYKIFLFERLEETGEKHNDEIIFDLDYKEISVCENEIYSISVENQDSEIPNNSLQGDFMEVDEIRENSSVYPNILTETPEEHGIYYEEFCQPQTSVTNNLFNHRNQTDYHSTQNFQQQQITLTPFESNILSHPNLMAQNYNNFANSQQLQQNFYSSQNGPVDFQSSNNYDQNMDTNLYPIQDGNEPFWFWNPQNEPF